MLRVYQPTMFDYQRLMVIEPTFYWDWTMNNMVIWLINDGWVWTPLKCNSDLTSKNWNLSNCSAEIWFWSAYTILLLNFPFVFYRNMRWFNQPISQYLPTQRFEATIYGDLKPLTNDMKKTMRILVSRWTIVIFIATIAPPQLCECHHSYQLCHRFGPRRWLRGQSMYLPLADGSTGSWRRKRQVWILLTLYSLVEQ